MWWSKDLRIFQVEDCFGRNLQLRTKTFNAVWAMKQINSILIFGFICATSANAQLVAKISNPKLIGDKALVSLSMRNDLDEPIQSARAACFLLDANGKMVGQSTKWVIGQPSVLEPAKTNAFSFVIPVKQSLASSNMTARIVFTELVLKDGKQADVKQNVKIEE